MPALRIFSSVPSDFAVVRTSSMSRPDTKTIRRGVYAGSFDPITNGHLYMIREGARLFDQLYVAIGTHPDKRYTFSVDERMEFLKRCTRGVSNVKLGHFINLFLVDYASRIGAGYILRG